MLPGGAEHPLLNLAPGLTRGPGHQQNGINQSGQYPSVSTLEKQLPLGLLSLSLPALSGFLLFLSHLFSLAFPCSFSLSSLFHPPFPLQPSGSNKVVIWEGFSILWSSLLADQEVLPTVVLNVLHILEWKYTQIELRLLSTWHPEQ